MSDAIDSKTLAALVDATVDEAWRHWATVGSGANADTPSTAIVDPEALILITLALRSQERRLDEVMHQWIVAHSRMLSTQRIKNLAGSFPLEVRAHLGGVAMLALHEAHDARWKTLADPAVRSPFGGTLTRHPSTLRLADASALMLRMRLALGVGIKADALSFLLGKDEWVDVNEVAAATRYHRTAVRRALDDLAMGAFIRSTDPAESPGHRKRRYRAVQRDWHVAGLGERQLAWGYFAERFALVAVIAAWLSGPGAGRQFTDIQWGDLAHTWMSAHGQAFRGVDDDGGDDREVFRGTLRERGLHFHDLIKQLTHWMQGRR